jgi:hypothetical protein
METRSNFEHRHKIGKEEGMVRLLAYRNRENMGRFADAIAAALPLTLKQRWNQIDRRHFRPPPSGCQSRIAGCRTDVENAIAGVAKYRLGR